MLQVFLQGLDFVLDLYLSVTGFFTRLAFDLRCISECHRFFYSFSLLLDVYQSVTEFSERYGFPVRYKHILML